MADRLLLSLWSRRLPSLWADRPLFPTQPRETPIPAFQFFSGGSSNFLHSLSSLSRVSIFFPSLVAGVPAKVEEMPHFPMSPLPYQRLGTALPRIITQFFTLLDPTQTPSLFCRFFFLLMDLQPVQFVSLRFSAPPEHNFPLWVCLFSCDPPSPPTLRCFASCWRPPHVPRLVDLPELRVFFLKSFFLLL